jgi:integrase
VSLGYRKPKAGAGNWIGRFAYINDDGQSRNLQHVLGLADDTEGEGMDYAAAMEHCLGMAYIHGPAPRATTPDYSVADATASYLRELAKQGRRASALHEAELTINAHIIPTLGTVQVRDLSTRDLKRWRDALLPGRKRATINRIWNTLRALLSLAFIEEKAPSDDAWRRIKPFKGVAQPRQRFLKVAEARALIENAHPRAFADLVRTGLATGCRLGELLALRVQDFDPAQGSLHIAMSKSGHPRDVILADDGVALFKRLTEAKHGSDPLFPGWGNNAHIHPMRRAAAAAGLGDDVTFHTLRHTWASHAVMLGMPLMVVARNLGHRDTRMVDRVYGHLSDDFRVAAVRDHAPKF